MTQPTDPGTSGNPFDYPTAPVQPTAATPPITYDESAYEAPAAASPSRPPEPGPRRPATGVGRGTIVLTAILAAGRDLAGK